MDDVRAVFFDLDDTLYPYPECNEAGKEAAFGAALDLGYDLDFEEFRDLYRVGRRETKRELAGTAPAHERFLYFKHAIEIHTGTHKSGDALALGEAYWDAYLEEMELFEGVEDTLETLTDTGLDIAVVTNLTTRIQLKKMEVLALERYVDTLVTSEETGREKPNSVMFTLPLSRLDRRPSEAVMVGDSVDADVEGANAVGLETVLFNADATGLRGRRRPDHRIDAFEELTDLLL